MRQSAWGSVLAAMTALGLLVGIVAAAEPPARPPLPGSDWPMYRHDPALTAASPLRGGLGEAPHVAWSLDLGGPHVPAESVLVRDVTGDGRDEFLTLSADAVTCRDSRGRLLWALDQFLNPRVLDVQDFAGDGSRRILLTTTTAGKTDTYLIDGRTGKATRLWRDENNFGGQTPPEPQGGDVRLVSFEHGLDRPHFHVHRHLTGVVYAPLLLFADLDGDGSDKLVVLSHEQVWAFDPRTGRQTFSAGSDGPWKKPQVGKPNWGGGLCRASPGHPRRRKQWPAGLETDVRLPGASPGHPGGAGSRRL